MSVQEPPRFTPAQILEAGHRAASEGRTEFARQFYSHLVASFPGTAEAHTAGQALERLRQVHPAQLVPPSITPAPEAARLEPSLPHSTPEAPHPRSEPAMNGRHHPAGLTPGPGTAVEEPVLPIELPEPVRDYRTGRILARATAWIGGVQVMLGLALLPLAVLSPRTLSGLPLIRALEPGAGAALGLVVSGLALIMVGQLVRALLDHANAARDMAAIQRAQAAHNPQAPRGQRRRRR